VRENTRTKTKLRYLARALGVKRQTEFNMNIENKFHSIFKKNNVKLQYKGFNDQGKSEVNCSFDHDGCSIQVSVESDDAFLFDTNQSEFSLYCREGGSSLELNCKANRFEAFKLNGYIREIKYSGESQEATSYLYDLAGANSPFIWNNLNWSREVEVAGNTYTIQFCFVRHQIKADLSDKVRRDTEAYKVIEKLIDDEVFIISHSFSFCRSSRTEWIMKKVLCDEYITEAHYLDSTAPQDFPNQVNPFRRDNSLWQSFLETTLNKGFSKEEFIESGIFQAISNLCWNNQMNDWTLIQHVSALEGLCKSDVKTIFLKPEYRKLRKSLYSSIDSFSGELESEKLDLLKSNLQNSERTLNGYSLKWYIENRFAELNLSGFYKKYYKEINAAINMRNKIAHEGWAREWEKDIMDHVKTLRNSIYLIISATFEYQEGLYLFGKKLPTKLGEHA